MAKENTTNKLLSEMSCSFCQTPSDDPVVLDCGHPLCDACVKRCQEFRGRPLCPLCKKPQSRQEWKMKLDRVTRLFRSECAVQEPREGEKCELHMQPLIYFCNCDKALLCAKCVETKESPDVLGVAEAAREYKDRYVQYTHTIKEENKEIMAHKLSTEEDSKALLEKAESIKQRMKSVFKEINEFLVQQEKILLNQLAKVMADIEEKRDEHKARLIQRVSFLDSILVEMEKSHQTPIKFLKNVGSTLEKFGETFRSPAAFPPPMYWGLYQFHDLTFLLDTVIEKFEGTLVSGYKMQEVKMTLDPDMGHSQFSLSKDLKSLKQCRPQDLSGSCDVLSRLPFALGCAAFTTGRHYWEVTVQGEDGWAVGVARSSVRRKRKCRSSFNPTDGIWAIGKWEGEYTMFSSPKESLPMNGKVLKRIRVSLNYDGKQVSFANADSDAVLAKFQTASFLGEPLRPIFWVEGETHLCLSS